MPRAYIERKKRRALKGNTRPNATETKSKAKVLPSPKSSCNSKRALLLCSVLQLPFVDRTNTQNTVHKLMIQPNPYVDSMSATAIMAEEAMARLERAAKVRAPTQVDPSAIR